MALSTFVRMRSLAALQGRSCLVHLAKQSPIVKPSVLVGVNIINQRLSSTHESHSKIWTIERMLSAGLLGLIPISFMTPIPGADYLAATALVVHIHWGLEAIVIDYIRPSIFGKVIPKVSLALLYLLSALSLGGLFYFNYTDVGIVNGVRMAWQKL